MCANFNPSPPIHNPMPTLNPTPVVLAKPLAYVRQYLLLFGHAHFLCPPRQVFYHEKDQTRFGEGCSLVGTLVKLRAGKWLRGLEKTGGGLHASFLESWERGHDSESDSISQIFTVSNYAPGRRGHKISVKSKEDGRAKNKTTWKGPQTC